MKPGQVGRIFIVLILFSVEACCIPLHQFFPYGAIAGDKVLQGLDTDGSSSLISLSPGLNILGRQRTLLRVSFSCKNNISLDKHAMIISVLQVWGSLPSNIIPT